MCIMMLEETLSLSLPLSSAQYFWGPEHFLFGCWVSQLKYIAFSYFRQFSMAFDAINLQYIFRLSISNELSFVLFLVLTEKDFVFPFFIKKKNYYQTNYNR